MWTTFEEALAEMPFNIGEFKAAEDILKKSKFLSTDIDDMDSIKKVQEQVVARYMKYVDEISKYYMEKVFIEKYYISVEDIARHLSVSLQFVKETIIEHLDRIEFPNSNYLAKCYMKKRILSSIENDNTYNEYGVCKNEFFESRFKELFRKKVLYSNESYRIFLANHMQLLEYNKTVNISINSLIMDTFKSVLESKFKVKVDTFFHKLFKDYLLHNQNYIDNCTSDEIFDFDGFLESKFNIHSTLYNISNYTNYHSINALKIKLDKFYDIEVLRIVRNSCSENLVFNLKINNSKKPLTRYILENKFLLDEYKKVLENENSQELNYYIKDDTFNFKVTIPKKFLRCKFNYNEELLTNDFIEFALNELNLVQ